MAQFLHLAVKALANSIAERRIGKERELYQRLLECMPEMRFEEEVTHDVLRAITSRPRGRQGGRPRVDVVKRTRDGNLQFAFEAKLVKRKNDKFIANEIIREENRLEVLFHADRIAFNFQPILILAGSRHVIDNLWITNPIVRAVLPCPFHRDRLLPFSANMYALYRRFAWDRLSDPLTGTWSYFSRARLWPHASIAQFGERLPLPKLVRITDVAYQGNEETAVCGFRLSRLGPNLHDDRERAAWLAQRFFAE